MIHTLAISSPQNPFVGNTPKLQKPFKTRPLPPSNTRPIFCFQRHNPNNAVDNVQSPTFTVNTNHFIVRERGVKKKKKEEEKRVYEEKEKGPNSPQPQVGRMQMMMLCGFGYWVQGLRCFPWLALNFHMATNLNLHPSTLQLVQHSANLPMVAKPLYGILSDAIYIGGAHRIPYIVTGGNSPTICLY